MIVDYPLFNRDYMLYNRAQGRCDSAMALMIVSNLFEKSQFSEVSDQSVIATEEIAANGRRGVREC